MRCQVCQQYIKKGDSVMLNPPSSRGVCQACARLIREAYPWGLVFWQALFSRRELYERWLKKRMSLLTK